MQENRQLTFFNTGLEGVIGIWRPQDHSPEHCIKLAGIKVCRYVQQALCGMPDQTLMRISPVLLNTSKTDTLNASKIYAIGYPEKTDGTPDPKRSFDFEWVTCGCGGWMEPETGATHEDRSLFEINFKAIQLIAISLLKETKFLKDGHMYHGNPKKTLVPFEYLLHRTSANNERPNWSLYRIQDPR